MHRAVKYCVSDGVHEGGASEFNHTLGELKARPYPPDHDDGGGGFAPERHSSELRNGLLKQLRGAEGVKTRRNRNEHANISPSFSDLHTFGLSRVHDGEGTLQDARKGHKGRNMAALAMSQDDTWTRRDELSPDCDDGCHQVAPNGTHRLRPDILEDLRRSYVKETTTPVREGGNVQLQAKAHRRRRVLQFRPSLSQICLPLSPG